MYRLELDPFIDEAKSILDFIRYEGLKVKVVEETDYTDLGDRFMHLVLESKHDAELIFLADEFDYPVELIEEY